MTDTGRLFADQSGTHPTERQHVLSRIAAALELPVAAFSERAPSGEPGPPSSTECAALLAAFSRIEDAGQRAAILKLMETLARR
jgi:hypothetical protein